MFEDAEKAGLVMKAMYGTKQGGILWGMYFHNGITDAGAVQTEADPRMYTFTKDGHEVIVEVHVDDILAARPNLGAVTKFKGIISERFDVRDLGRGE